MTDPKPKPEITDPDLAGASRRGNRSQSYASGGGLSHQAAVFALDRGKQRRTNDRVRHARRSFRPQVKLIDLRSRRVRLVLRLKEAFPAISRIAALWNPADPVALRRRATEEAARTLGLQLHILEVPTLHQIPPGFEKAAAAGDEALVVLPDATFWNERVQIVTRAARTGCR